ncbi:MAG TPA: hypothetical protein PK509_09215 [Catalimonadaceae bacterium]|nr:hypothetical protein [Catalimonadaceae bacterium]HPI10261.1 hypothetical protein [Catalimonadaceae bacterium]
MTILHSGIKQVVATSMIAFLVSCGSEPKKVENAVDSTALVQDSQILDAVEDLFGKLPKPSAIPNLIVLTGAEYESKLLNPASNAEKVMGNSSKAAFSVGVFSADVGYMAAYDKGQEAVQTFVIGKKLADKIGVSSAFDSSVLERIEKNLAQKDSLITISDASIANSSGILKANDQIKDAALLTAGAFVEGLYLTCGLIHDYPPTGLPKVEQDKILVPLVNAVIKQEGALSSLIELLQKVNDNDEVVTSIIAGLEKSKAIYAKANWAERIANNKGDLIPTENDIKDLAKSIAELRKGMVE